MAGSRLRNIRVRTTVVATVVVALAIAGGSTFLLVLVRSNLSASIRDFGITRAETLADLARNDSLPEILPTRGNVVAQQVFTDDGTVVAWSAGMRNVPPLAVPHSPGAVDTYRDDELGEFLEDRIGEQYEGGVIVVALGTTAPEGPLTILVMSSLDTEDTIDVMIDVLIPVVPALLLLVGVVTWWVTGRALRPVEAMRSEAETITGTDLHRRLPVPAGSDEIHRLAETMNRMLDRLEQSSGEQRRFVADASHELKSPVAAMRTMLEVARANPDTVDMETLTADLLYEDLRLESLVGDLLTLARSDEGAIHVNAIDIDLDDLVREEAAAASGRGTPLDVSGVAALQVRGDQEQLRRVLRNLIDNALRHAAGRVWIETTSAGDSGVLSVSNDGSPIPPEERERIFERFVRLDEARARDEGGSGLGLAVSRAIVRAHDGDLNVVDPLHDGTTFELRLPLS